MGLKRGRIVEEDTPQAGTVRIRRFRLSTGDRVYLPLEVASFLMTRHAPPEEFFFIEKGLLGRVSWAGTLHELRLALASGAVAPGDVKGLRLPVQETYAGWNPQSEEDDHSTVGARMGEIAEIMRRNGRPETAPAMTIEAWVLNQSSQGGCMNERADTGHGRIRCAHDRGHTGDHEPVCPECNVVKEVMYAAAQSAGQWGR